MQCARFAQCRKQGAVDRSSVEDHPAHFIIQPPPGDGAALLCAHRAFDSEAALRQDGDGDFGEPALTNLALHPRKRGVLRPVQPDRHNRRIGLVGHHAGAIKHLHQRAGNGDAAFGEDHQHPPLAHSLDHRLGSHRVGWINRECLEQLEERAHPDRFGDVGVDRKGRLAGQKRAEHQPVEQRQMVDHHHRPFARQRQVFQPANFGAVKQAQGHADRAFEQRFWQQPHARQRYCQRRKAEHPDQAGNAHARRQQPADGQHCQHRDPGIDDIVGGNHPRTFFGRATDLKDGV